MRSDRTLLVAWRTCTFSTALLLSTMHAAQAELTVLTIDGEVRTISANFDSAQRRVALGENGLPMVVDEFAAVRTRDRGTELSFITEALEPSRARLATLKINETPNHSRLAAATRNPALSEALIIQHQPGHPPNHNFTPTPSAEFVSQPVIAEALEGHRGFAVVGIGESGRILRLKLFLHGQVLMDRNLETAIIDGLKTTFKDERRHDHTVYMAYEIRSQTVSQLGSSAVTLPMCVPICQ